eukprot:CAMPEP_0197594842 /NCGR_PEP_ID=MMETSP1326-20131121/21546_1 /TAXON_ID=1155430 /ORGANISM="Genus nov. species nov., Strain RCC2288" /LENGTH=59 /DNA_ID=CAMNT_0043161095 /DNA_START=12 /DNA_END=188 /DNA_ORIENTATION=-
MNRKTAGAFDKWTEYVQEAKEMRVLLKRAAGKMMKRQLSAAFARWHEMVTEKVGLRRKM